MIIEERAEDLEGREVQALPEPVLNRAYAYLLALITLVGIFAWAPVDQLSRKGSYYERKERMTAQAEVSKGDRP